MAVMIAQNSLHLSRFSAKSAGAAGITAFKNQSTPSGAAKAAPQRKRFRASSHGLLGSSVNSAGSAKRGKFPTLLVALLVVVIAIVVLLNMTLQQESDGRFLSIESNAPNGAGALATVLQEQGVEVIDVHEQAQLQQVSQHSTVVITNPNAIESEDIETLLKSGAQILILVDEYAYYLPMWGIEAITVKTTDPANGTFTASGSDADDEFNSPFRSAQENFLRQYADGKKLTSQCNLAAAEKAKSIAPVENVFRGYTLDLGETRADAVCFPLARNDGELDAALIHAPNKPNVLAFSAPVIFTNTFLARDGNAAFALNLLGKYQQVYWVENYYTPFDDAQMQLGESDGLPKWISILAVALLCSGGWLVLYRARRFGKLVPEPMPVVVPSGESDLGRAQLYAHGQDYAYLGRILRNHFLEKFAHQEIVDPSQTENMIASLHLRSKRSPAELTDVLFAREIRTKSDLVKLQEELEALAKEL